MDKKDEQLEKFLIACKNCSAVNRKHDTFLYVDWKKKYYLFTCYTCDATEAFNEEAKKINLEDKKKDGGEDDKSGSGAMVN
jgi:hypothetical protein